MTNNSIHRGEMFGNKLISEKMVLPSLVNRRGRPAIDRAGICIDCAACAICAVDDGRSTGLAHRNRWRAVAEWGWLGKVAMLVAGGRMIVESAELLKTNALQIVHTCIAECSQAIIAHIQKLLDYISIFVLIKCEYLLIKFISSKLHFISDKIWTFFEMHLMHIVNQTQKPPIPSRKCGNELHFQHMLMRKLRLHTYCSAYWLAFKYIFLRISQERWTQAAVSVKTCFSNNEFSDIPFEKLRDGRWLVPAPPSPVQRRSHPVYALFIRRCEARLSRSPAVLLQQILDRRFTLSWNSNQIIKERFLVTLSFYRKSNRTFVVPRGWVKLK